MAASYGITNKSRPVSPVPMQTLLGIDPGNGFIKARTDKGDSIILPSLIAYPTEYFEGGVVAQNGCSVLYVSGSRSDLVGKQILIGDIAYSIDPLNCISIAKSPQAKADYALELLLGAVGLLPQCDRIINPVLSVHDSTTFGDKIKQQVEGVHRIQLDGKPLDIEISNTTVTPEGKGTYYYLLKSGKVKKSELILLFDLGFGTSIYTVFQEGKILERSIFRWGVRDLYNSICQCSDMRRALNGIEGDIQVIRAAIESKKFTYRTEEGIFDFTKQYTEALVSWTKSNLKQAMDKMRPRIPKAEHLFLVGGGGNLPSISNYFIKKGFEILSNSQVCNAEGLLLIAQARSQQNGNR
ncbi:MAG: ParM/StbA family protein [Okeania sp. SIO3C4]|nr:ParM/StbA family protein [Okeania sp. SIO3C4]